MYNKLLKKIYIIYTHNRLFTRLDYVDNILKHIKAIYYINNNSIVDTNRINNHLFLIICSVIRHFKSPANYIEALNNMSCVDIEYNNLDDLLDKILTSLLAYVLNRDDRSFAHIALLCVEIENKLRGDLDGLQKQDTQENGKGIF